MIRDFHVAKREEDISFYGGFIGCALLVGRFVTAVHWGLVADRYGQKPVMIISTMAVLVLQNLYETIILESIPGHLTSNSSIDFTFNYADFRLIFNAMFGLSKSYWMAITSRFLLGAFNGVLGPMRAYATEVSRKEHQALGVSMIASAWGIGLVIGPALGGYLAQPAEKFPNVFSQELIFGRFPYFLVSLVISVFALFVFVICFWLPETLHSHAVEDDAMLALDDVENLRSIKARTSTNWLSHLKNRPLMSIIILYSIFQMHDMAYSELFSLWSVSPRSLGGLSFGTNDVGQALAVAGIGLLLCNVFLYPVLERSFGPMPVSRAGAVLSIVLLACLPFTTNLTGTTLSLVIDLASALQNVLGCVIITGLFLLQNRAVSQQQRGAANGLSLCIVSFCNAFGPAVAGSILSWAQSRQNASFLPGSHMVFFILNVVKLVGLLMTFEPFLVKPAQEFS